MMSSEDSGKVWDNNGDLLITLENMDAELKQAAKDRKADRALLEKMNANILVVKLLSLEGKAELLRTRHALLKGIFEATEVGIPTTFTLVNEILPPAKSVEEAKQKILDIVAAEDDSGTSLKTDDIVVEGDLREHYEKFKTGMKWVKRINEIGSKVAACEVGRAFDIIDDGISDLINAEEMYLYLVDELTGKPVQAEGWPLINHNAITRCAETDTFDAAWNARYWYLRWHSGSCENVWISFFEGSQDFDKIRTRDS